MHAALIAARPLDSTIAEFHWLNIIASRNRKLVEVKPYQDGLCGLGYILKRLGSVREDIRFSSNLAAFVPDAASRFYGRKGPEKRQLSRIRTQIQNAVNPARNAL